MFKLDKNIKDINLKIPTLSYCSTDTISQFIGVAGENREVSQQISDVDRNPISRRFSDFFVEDSSATLEVRTLDQYDDFYESTFFYLVATQFSERSYESLVPTEDIEPFTEWNVRKITYRREIHYKPSLISTVTWERPYILSTSTVPGEESQKEYQEVEEPLIVTFDANKAVAANFSDISNNCVVYNKATLDGEEVGDLISNPTSSFLCYKRYIQVVCENPNELELNPIFLTVNFYGEPVFNFNLPIDSQKEYTLIHPEGTPLAERLFPPGRYNAYPSNFWNSGNKPPLIESYSNRGGNPGLV